MEATILIVDDARAMRTLLRKALSGRFKIRDAADGGAGLEVARSEKIDAFVVDLNMPVLDGIGLTRALRELPQYRETPIFILTTEAQGGMAAEGTAAGATAWIVKPFQPENLLRALDSALARTR